MMKGGRREEGDIRRVKGVAIERRRSGVDERDAVTVVASVSQDGVALN